jgi:hypothetical protein
MLSMEIKVLTSEALLLKGKSPPKLFILELTDMLQLRLG